MPISYNFKTIFVHIPKNAGTSVEKYLGTGSINQLYSHKPVKETSLIYNKEKFTPAELFNIDNICPQHLDAKNLQRIIDTDTFNSFYKFAVIGNPYNRMISEYYYVQANEHARYKPYQNLTFDKFLDKAFSASKEEQLTIFDSHLSLQSSFILSSNGDLLVDQIFSMENIPELEAKLKEITGLNQALPTARASPNYDRAKLLTDRNKELIYRRFKTDFQLFDYKK